MGPIGNLDIEIRGKYDRLIADLNVAENLAKESGSRMAGGINAAFDAVGGKQGLAIAGATAVATAVGLIGRAAFEAADKYNTALRSMAFTTGATGSELAKLGTSFDKVFASRAEEAEAVAGAMSRLAIETGRSGQELEQATRAYLDFAKVTGQDVVKAVKETQDVFDQFGVSLEDQEVALDKLYVVTIKTGIAASELAGNLKSAGPVLSQFGFTFEEAASLIGKLEQTGEGATKTITALTRAMVEWSELGIKDPKAALLDLVDKIKSAKTETEAIDLAAQNFSKRGAVELSKAIRDGAFDFQKLSVEIGNTKGAIDNSVGSVATWREEWAKFTNQVDSAASKVGGPLLQKTNESIALMRIMMNGLRSFIPGLKDAESAATPAAKAVGDLGNQLKKAATETANLNRPLQRTPAELRAAADAAEKAAKAKAKLAEEAKKAAEQYHLLNLEFAAFDAKLKSEDRLKLIEQMFPQELLDDWANQFKKLGQAWDEVVKEENTQRAINRLELLTVTVNGVTFSVEELAQVYDIMANSAEKSIVRAMEGYEAMEKAVRAGIASQYDLQAALDAVRKAQGEQVNESVSGSKKQKEALKEVSTVLTNMHQDIARMIVNWKDFGKTAINIAKRIGEAILSDIIGNLILTESRMKKVTGALGGLLSKIPGLGGLFGGKSSGVQLPDLSSIPGAGGLGGKSSGSLGSLGALGAMGPVGIALMAVEAAMSLWSNFQQKRMEKDIGRIEVTSREIKAELMNFRTDAWAREGNLMTKLDDIWRDIQKLRDILWFGKINVHIASGTRPGSAEELLDGRDTTDNDALVAAGRADMEAVQEIVRSREEVAREIDGVGESLGDITEDIERTSKSLRSLSAAVEESVAVTASNTVTISNREQAELEWLRSLEERQSESDAFWAARMQTWTGRDPGTGASLPTGEQALADFSAALRTSALFSAPLESYRAAGVYDQALAALRSNYQSLKDTIQEGAFELPGFARGVFGGATEDEIFAKEAWERAFAQWDFEEGKISMEELAKVQARITNKYQEILRQRFMDEGHTGLTEEQEALSNHMRAAGEQFKTNIRSMRDLNSQINDLRRQAFNGDASANKAIQQLFLDNPHLAGMLDPQGGGAMLSPARAARSQTATGPALLALQSQWTQAQSDFFAGRGPGPNAQTFSDAGMPQSLMRGANAPRTLPQFNFPAGTTPEGLRAEYSRYLNELRRQLTSGDITWKQYTELADAASNRLGQMEMSLASRFNGVNIDRLFSGVRTPTAPGMPVNPIAPQPVPNDPMGSVPVTVNAVNPSEAAVTRAFVGGLQRRGIRVR